MTLLFDGFSLKHHSGSFDVCNFACSCLHRLLTMMTVIEFVSFNIFQYFVEAGAIAVRRVRKEDLRHVAKATGATMVCLHSYVTIFFLNIGRILVQSYLEVRQKIIFD
jgi:hypothetical protein